MSTFVESDHPRAHDGKFVEKPTLPPSAATVAAVLSAVDDEAAADELDAARVRYESLHEHLAPIQATFHAGASDETLMRNWRELYRLRSSLGDAENKLAGELADKIGEGTVTCSDGRVAHVKIGKLRNEWADETLWSHVETEASQLADRSPEEAVCDTARHYLAAGGYKADGLRGMGLKPADYATYTPRLDDDGNEIPLLVPTDMVASNDDELAARFKIARLFSGASMADRSPTEIADRVAEVQRARATVRDLEAAHEKVLLSRVPRHQELAVPGVGTVIHRIQGNWTSWNHDAVWTDIARSLKARAPAGGGTAARYELAVNRLREAVGGAGWKKRAVGAAGLLGQTLMTRPGTRRVIIND